MSAVHKVLISGGGIAGLTLAIALRQKGFQVDLVEVKKEWTVYGVGIIQQANVVRAMASLGLVDRYVATAYPFSDVGLYKADGEPLGRMHMHGLAGTDYPVNMGVSRLALHLMLSATALELGTNVRVGVAITELTQDEHQAQVTFSDGTTGDYDLVVGAEGVYSKTRSLVFGEHHKPRFTGQAVWRHNFPRTPEIDHLANYYGKNGNAGLVPLAENLMYMYLTTQEPGNPYMPPETLADTLRERMEGFGGLVGELREQITDPKSVVYKPMEVFFLYEPWFRNRVVLIGDAAHTTTPHAGQGAGIAIEDAIVLAEELQANEELPTALNKFMARRYERCRQVVEGSIQIGDWEMQGAPESNRISMLQKITAVTQEPI